MISGSERLDTLVQSSTVELFQSYGMAVAPLSRGKMHDVAVAEAPAAWVRFSGGGFNAVLTLTVPAKVIELTKKDSRHVRRKDWIQELTNQLMGRIKNRLLRWQITLQTTLPIPVEEPKRALQSPALVYLFRTLHGEVVVTIEGRTDQHALTQSETGAVAKEGDIIVF